MRSAPSGIPTTRSPTPTPAARSTARPSSRARSRGWSAPSATRTPPTSRRRSTARASRGSAASSRGRCGDRDAGPRRYAGLRATRCGVPSPGRRAIEGSPAEKAGLRAGDLILATDGAALDGLTVDAARDRVRGPKGTAVTLRIQRDAGAPFDVAITRDVVQRREVTSKVLGDGSVGYVRLSDFSDAAAATVREDLAAHVAAGRTALILDLRGDPGGFVTAARSVASEFIGSGPIFWEQDAKGGQLETRRCRAASRPTRSCASSASSTAAAPRRARSSPAPSRIRSGPRSSARPRSARGPCSAGPSSPARAGRSSSRSPAG